MINSINNENNNNNNKVPKEYETKTRKKSRNFFPLPKTECKQQTTTKKWENVCLKGKKSFVNGITICNYKKKE